MGRLPVRAQPLGSALTIGARIGKVRRVRQAVAKPKQLHAVPCRVSSETEGQGVSPESDHEHGVGSVFFATRAVAVEDFCSGWQFKGHRLGQAQFQQSQLEPAQPHTHPSHPALSNEGSCDRVTDTLTETGPDVVEGKQQQDL